MTQPPSIAQQIAQTAIAFEERRLGRRPKSVTVVLGGDTLESCLLPNKSSPKAQQVPLKGRRLRESPGWKYAKSPRIRRPPPSRCSQSARWSSCSYSPVASCRLKDFRK